MGTRNYHGDRDFGLDKILQDAATRGDIEWVLTTDFKDNESKARYVNQYQMKLCFSMTQDDEAESFIITPRTFVDKDGNYFLTFQKRNTSDTPHIVLVEEIMPYAPGKIIVPQFVRVRNPLVQVKTEYSNFLDEQNHLHHMQTKYDMHIHGTTPLFEHINNQTLPGELQPEHTPLVGCFMAPEPVPEKDQSAYMHYLARMYKEKNDSMQ